MARYENFIVTKEFLDENLTAIFVFGDNILREGYGGAAVLRDHPRAYGFITKKSPNNLDYAFYKLEDYKAVFMDELIKLKEKIKENPFDTFYISQLGAGLANKHKIWENIIKDGLEKNLKHFSNVVFLWDDDVL